MKHTPRRGARDIFGSIQDVGEKERLVAALGHDIKGPLQVLGLSLQNLLLRPTDAETKEVLFAAESAFHEVASLNEDLLDALRFGVGVVTPREEGITLANLFGDLERRFRRRAANEEVKLRFVPTRIHCVADRHYLQRILGNLVENALKHANARRIVVGARLRSDDFLTLEVIDNGRGIPSEEVPYVFEEWFRGQQAKREGTRGQGLGLWAVDRCAEVMQGTVSVESIVGKGTRFSVELPVYAERRPLPAAVPTATIEGLQAKLVAILDDDRDVLQALRMSLEAIGVRVFSATDDLYFLARVTGMTDPPHLFLLDFNLGAHTIERTMRVLKGRFGDALRAILITGHPNDRRLQSLSAEIPVLAKPISADKLQMIVGMLSGAVPYSPEAFD